MDSATLSLVEFARQHSPYYRSLYNDVKLDDSTQLHELPMVQHDAYWRSNTVFNNQLITTPLIDGVVFKTGGTTGHPKYAALSQTELQQTGIQLGQGLVAAGLRAGDRVANMFYAGDLWGSFLLHVLSILSSPVPALHLPIGGLTSPDSSEGLLREWEATVVLSTITSLVRLAKHALPAGRCLPKVRCVMFGGEALFPDQRSLLQKLFPAAKFRACIYASMDCGVIGVAADDEDSRMYRTANPCIVIEICNDEEGKEVIGSDGLEGNLLVTSLIRRLTPVIRYPTGDRAVWVDKNKGLFRVLGRGNVAIRLGPVSIDVADLRDIAAACLQPATILGLQALITRIDERDALQCRVAAEPTPPEDASERLVSSILKERPMLGQHIQLCLIHGINVEFVELSQLEVNSRTGKLPAVIDRR